MIDNRKVLSAIFYVIIPTETQSCTFQTKTQFCQLKAYTIVETNLKPVGQL